jgi:hypothetical protein
MLRTAYATLLMLVLACTAAAQLKHAWRDSAMAFVPADYVAGSVYRTDLATMTGYLAVYPVGADNPGKPASTFAPRQGLVVRLRQTEGGLRAASAELRPRADVPPGDRDTTTVNPDEVEQDYARLHRELAAKARTLPMGTEPCDLGAWSEEKGRLAVRAQPSPKARVLGHLPAPYRYKSKSENFPEGGWLTEFRIVGYRAAWFLIEGAQPPGKRYEDDGAYPRNHPKPFAGRGWVPAEKVGAQYANGDTRMGGLFQAPHVDARWTPAKNEFGGTISADGGPKRIFACSGLWALVESHDGIRGWWRRICASQVTNCS